MANLGNLFFGVRLQDMTDQDWDKIVKSVEKKSLKFGLSVDGTKLRKSIDEALANKKYTIDLSVAVKDNQIEAAIRNAYNRVASMSGLNTKVRSSREDQLLKAGAYADAQKALERSREALAKLREARLRDMEATRQQKTANDALGKSMQKTGNFAQSLRNQISNIYSVYMMESFLSSLIRVGGEFQKQHIALQAMLGDAAKADTIFSQIKELAVESPFNFQNLTGYTKQLAAFSIPYEELYETTKRLADISSGLGIDMGRIILAYGQVRSAEFLRGTELRQFTEAGIPLLDQLAKKFSQLEGQVVSVGEVFDKISMREVPFEMVKEVLWDLTNEGGQFYKMQEVLTESLSGKLDKLKDSYQIMLSTIAESNNWLIGGSLDMLTNLTSHWETMLTTLKAIIAALGTYKTVVFLANASQAIQILRVKGLTAALNENTLATIANGNAQTRASLGGVKLLGTISKLKTLLSSIGSVAGGWGIILSALVAIGTYAYNAYKETNKLRNELEETAAKGAVAYKSSVDDLRMLVDQLGKAVKGSQEYNEIIDTIQSRYGAYLDNIKAEADAYEYLKSKIDEVNQALLNRAKTEYETSGMSQINEEYVDDIKEAVDDIESQLQKELDVSKSEAIQLARVIRERIQKAVNDGLKPSEITYNKTTKMLSSIAEEFGIKIGSTVRKSMDIGNGTVISSGGATKTVRNIRSLTKAYYDMNNAVNMLHKTSEEYFSSGQSNGYIERLEESYKEASKSLNNTEKEEAYLKLLDDKIAVYEKLGQKDEVRKLQSEKKAIENLKDDWYKVAYAINEARKASGKKAVPIGLLPSEKSGKEGRSIDYYKQLAEAAYKAQEEINKISLIPEGMRTDANKLSLESNKAILEYIEEYERQTGVPIKQFGETKKIRGEGQKDEFAEQMKERLSLIKDAYNEYEKWMKLVGKQEAIKKMQESPTFAVLFQEGDFDPSAYAKNVQDVIDRINKNGATTKSRRDIVKNAEKLKFDIDGDYLKEQAGKTLKEGERYIQDTTKKWDLYKQLFEATGDKEYSMSIAFSDAPVWDEAATAMREELEKRMEAKGIKVKLDFTETEEEAKRIFGSEDSELYKLWNETKKRIEENGIDLKVNAAKAIEDTMSIQDKIRAKEAQKSEALQPYQAGTPEYEAIAKQFDNEINQLKASLFELSPSFQLIFQDMTGMSIRQINKLRKEAQSVLDLIDATKEAETDADGNIVRYSYTNKDGNIVYIDKDTYDEIIKQLGRAEGKTSEVQIAFGRMWDWISGKKQKDGTKYVFQDIAKDLSILTQEAANAAGSIASMFEAFGNDSLSDGFSFAGEMLGSVSSIASGLASGNPFAVIGGIASGITSIAGLHDKKLDRAIERSQQRAQVLKNTYDEIERSLERFLGDGRSMKLTDAENDREELRQINAEIDNIRKKGRINIFDQKKLQGYEKDAEKLQKRVSAYDEGGAYGYQRQLLEEQYAELEKQRQAELDKKKTDPSKVADYEAQMSELRDQITYFAQDLASELYGIDLKDWASQLGDALYEAWQKGEDGAEAFKNKAGEIIGDVMNEVLKMRILEPAMKDISDYLFGTDEEREANGGKGGVFGTDMELSDDDVKGLADKFIDMSNTSEQYTEAMDKVNEYLKQLGYDIKDAGESSGGLSASIGKITEDQADLLASYINGIRADVSLNKELFKQLVNDTLPGMSRIAQAQLRHLETIARNTGNNAESAAEILEILRRNVNGANKFNI